ncbi:MAG: hypothetical protein RLZZ500_1061 [Bacteroidota bacterium]|jgi:amino acid permease
MRIKQVFYTAVLLLLNSVVLSAQCAMCRASLESEGNTVKAEAVNDGIVYLMIFPYILVAIVGYVVYRMFTKKKATS